MFKIITAIAIAFAPAAIAQEAPVKVSVAKQCGTQWKADRDGLTSKGYAWPAYWSVCAKSMKANGVVPALANVPARLAAGLVPVE